MKIGIQHLMYRYASQGLDLAATRFCVTAVFLSSPRVSRPEEPARSQLSQVRAARPDVTIQAGRRQ